MQNIEDLETTKRDSIELAGKIFKTVTHPEIISSTTPEERHELCVKKYDLFSKAYPLVLAKIAVESRYNEVAFIKFLNKLYSKPGQGIEGIIQNQAYYAKVLYMEECNVKNKRWCPKMASEIYTYEYENMIRWVNDTKKLEKKVKHEFEEEGEKHEKELRDEFKEWFIKERKNFVFDNDGKQDIKELITRDDDYQQYMKSNDVVVKENVESMESVELTEKEIEKQKRVDEAVKQRNIKEIQENRSDWVDNSSINHWRQTTKQR